MSPIAVILSDQRKDVVHCVVSDLQSLFYDNNIILSLSLFLLYTHSHSFTGGIIFVAVDFAGLREYVRINPRVRTLAPA